MARSAVVFAASDAVGPCDGPVAAFAISAQRLGARVARGSGCKAGCLRGRCPRLGNMARGR
eukprot:8437795-Alexandrium_andersonii.AAC.1